jgi:UDP-2,4-diacetamido-2,4,6-trideoxy-beta-L-altropyranose hydrolase
MRRTPKQSLLVRADASTTIGTGHLVRCLAIAHELHRRGWQASFAARDIPAGLRGEIEAAGYSFFPVPRHIPTTSEPAYLETVSSARFSVAIVDRYGIDAAWHRAAARLARSVAAIDDLARAEQAVEVLVNQNLGYSESHYEGLVPASCRLLIGPEYAMLRREFREARLTGLRNRDHVRRILVFMSGGDAGNVTGQVVAALAETDAAIDVVVGSAYPHMESLRHLAGRQGRTAVHQSTPDMAKLMVQADLAVGAPSSASWERCCLGLPTVTITLAENQSRVAAALSAVGATVSLGWYDAVDRSAIAGAVAQLSGSPSRLREMSEIAARVTDGRGAERVADVLEEVAAHA